MSLGWLICIVAVLPQSALGAKPVIRTTHSDVDRPVVHRVVNPVVRTTQPDSGSAPKKQQKNVVRSVLVNAKGKLQDKPASLSMADAGLESIAAELHSLEHRVDILEHEQAAALWTKVSTSGWCNAGFLAERYASSVDDCQQYCLSFANCKFASYQARGDGYCMVYSTCDPSAMAGSGHAHWSLYDTWQKQAAPATPAATAAYDLNPGATCKDGYAPLTSSWQDCKSAAELLGFSGDSVAHVDYVYTWGSSRPQGCFQSDGNNRIHFNAGQGGSFTGSDKILCQKAPGHYVEEVAFGSKSCEDWRSTGDGQRDLGGPNWPSASTTKAESLAACKRACDADNACQYITWYEDLGCRTYTSCVDPVDDVPAVVKHIYRKQATTCRVTVYEHWPEGIATGIAGLEAAELAWGGHFPTGASKILTGTGKHSLGTLTNLTSSVKVEGTCCKAYGYTSTDCLGTQGNAIESTTQLLAGLPAGVVTPATGLGSMWGCNDCAQCVEVVESCAATSPTNAPTNAPTNSPTNSACMSAAIAGRSPGSSLGKTTQSSIEACETFCVDTSGCLAITYRASSGDCWRLNRAYEGNYQAASDDCVVSNKIC